MRIRATTLGWAARHLELEGCIQHYERNSSSHNTKVVVLSNGIIGRVRTGMGRRVLRGRLPIGRTIHVVELLLLVFVTANGMAFGAGGRCQLLDLAFWGRGMYGRCVCTYGWRRVWMGSDGYQLFLRGGMSRYVQSEHVVDESISLLGRVWSRVLNVEVFPSFNRSVDQVVLD